MWWYNVIKVLAENNCLTGVRDLENDWEGAFRVMQQGQMKALKRDVCKASSYTQAVRLFHWRLTDHTSHSIWVCPDRGCEPLWPEGIRLNQHPALHRAGMLASPAIISADSCLCSTSDYFLSSSTVFLFLIFQNISAISTEATVLKSWKNLVLKALFSTERTCTS